MGVGNAMPDFRDSGLAFRGGAEIAERQNELLYRHVRYLAQFSPFYRKRFREAGIDPNRIRTVADLGSLPLTIKSDLAASQRRFSLRYPRTIVDLCLTSGTTGRPLALAADGPRPGAARLSTRNSPSAAPGSAPTTGC